MADKRILQDKEVEESVEKGFVISCATALKKWFKVSLTTLWTFIFFFCFCFFRVSFDLFGSLKEFESRATVNSLLYLPTPSSFSVRRATIWATRTFCIKRVFAIAASYRIWLKMFSIKSELGKSPFIFSFSRNFGRVKGPPIIIETLLCVLSIKVEARKEIYLPKKSRHNPQLYYLSTCLLILVKSILQEFDKLHPSPINLMSMLLHQTLVVIISKHTSTILHTTRHQITTLNVRMTHNHQNLQQTLVQ